MIFSHFYCQLSIKFILSDFNNMSLTLNTAIETGLGFNTAFHKMLKNCNKSSNSSNKTTDSHAALFKILMGT
jgi:hypothetical protein